MQFNDAGRMVYDTWNTLPQRFPQMLSDVFVVMPNHLHGIIVFVSDLPDAQDLGAVVGAFKSMTTHAYIRGVRERGWPRFDGRLWQRNYCERIIRNREELDRARAYIHENPAGWVHDRENPHRAT